MAYMTEWREQRWPGVRVKDFTPEQLREYQYESMRRYRSSSRFKDGYRKSRNLWNKSNKDRVREYNFRLRYGRRAVEHWDEQYELQGGKCDICSKTPVRVRLYQDHDHACCQPTDKGSNNRYCGKCSRGLLCATCNLQIAGLEDPEWKSKAEAYLAKWNKRS